MQSKTLISTFLLVLLGAVSSVAHAQAYQWKDSSGRTIISDQPPPKGVAGASSTADPGVSSSAPKVQQEKSLTDQDLEFKKRRLESQEKADKAAKEAADKKSQEENCDRARRYLATLESGVRTGRRNDKGEMEIMDDATRASEREKVSADIAKNCK